MQDKKNYDRPQPRCMSKSENTQSFDNLLPFRRKDSLDRFILDVLCEHGRKIESNLLTKYNNLGKPGHSDQDIQKEFQKVKEVSYLKSELSVIEKHVKHVHQSWQKVWGTRPHQNNFFSVSCSREDKRENKKDLDTALNQVRKEFATNPEGTQTLQLLGIAEMVKASCAFSINEKFAFTVAFRDLCLIKAKAKDTHAPMMREFADILGIPASFARLFGQDTL
jgi:RNA-dependent RNA polymerase